MKKDWQMKKIGEVCEIVNGGTPKTGIAEYWDGPHQWITPAEMGKRSSPYISKTERTITDEGLKNSSARLLQPHSVIMSSRAPIGHLAINTEPMATNQGCKGMTPGKLLECKYLYYYLAASIDLLNDLGTGATFKELSGSKLKEVTIPIPPLAEQQRIVAILDEAFAGIATAKANTEKNLQNARAIFESHLQSVFTQHGPGWVEKQLGDKALLEIIDGDRGVNYPNGSDFQEEGYCLFMNTKNVRPDGFEFETTMFITEEKDRKLRQGKLKRDDVVLTTRGTIGNVGIYSDDIPFDNIRINSGMLIFRPNKHALLPSFLFEMLRSEIVKNQIRKQTTGAAQPQLPIKTLVNFTIPLPTNIADQAALVQKLRSFEPETKRLESIYQQKLTSLDELKKSLLHRAFSGEL
ncbi:MAG TPA: restriction endonuclease subunit S [Candidatus Rifleibacterium sp.]|nr:restriction endonuclease subunit S [Candidatus Rifleibacterium sp.]